ncbi:MAG: hypothetical protein AB4426_21785 [Xenococcaceae cyanobacterium]
MSESFSPYEANILNFDYIAKKQPELFTAEDRADLGKLLGTLPDDVEKISDAIVFFYK